MKEGNQDRLIMLEASKMGCRLFRNSKGMFLTLDGERKIHAGLIAKGSSDLIGFKPVTITENMIGDTVAVFCALEDKVGKGKPSKDQQNFVDFVNSQGGIAGVVWSVEEAVDLLK